jgi:hypothetical protein
MGIRGELYSTKVMLANRTYFFNVKENRMGDLYLNIVESKNRDSGGFDRQSVILFADDMQEFLKGFDESLRVMEKAVREKRRAKPPAGAKPLNKEPAKRGEPRSRQDSKPGFNKPGFDKPGFKKTSSGKTGFSKPGFTKPSFNKPSFGKPGRKSDSNRKSDPKAKGKRRVVVKK